MLKIGDKIRDNDPRIRALGERVLTVKEILPESVVATDIPGRKFTILQRRIYADGKLRKKGFDLLQDGE